MDNLRDQQQHIAILKQVASQPQNQPRLVSVPPAANVPLPHFPKDVQVTRGLRSRCRQRIPMLSVRAVTQRQTDYRTLMRSLVDALGLPVSRSWSSSSRHHQMKSITAKSTPGQDARSSLSQKKRRKEVRNDNVI